MLFPLKAWIKKRIQNYLASLPHDKGTKLLLRLYDRLYFYTLGVIKIQERSRGGIHPKHWITDFHDFFLDNIEPEDTVLEVGCAYGHISNVIAEKAKRVIAIDIRPDAIKQAKEQFCRDNLFFKCNDLFSFSNDECFNVVILSNVLEHINDRVAFLKKASNYGEKLLIRVPAFDRDWIIPYKKSLNLEWRLNKDHKIEYTEGILRNEVKQANLFVNTIYCKWGNYCCIATKNNGIQV